MANSAVGRQIQNLEEMLDIQLFERLPRGIRLTNAGELVLRHATETLEEYDLLCGELDALRGRVAGEIRIATLESWCVDFLPAQIFELKSRHPALAFRVRSTLHSRICDAVLNGEADFGLTFDLPFPSDLKLVQKVPMPLMAMVSPDHPLAGEKAVTLARCAEFEMTLQLASEPVRSIIAMELSGLERSASAFLTTNNLHLHRQAILAGRAVGLFTWLAFASEVRQGRVVAVPLRGTRLSDLKLGLLLPAHRRLSHAIQVACDLIGERLRQSLVPLPG